MAAPINPPRGMRDFLPAEKARRERVLAVIRASYRDHGFDEIETPVMEEASRLHAGLGGDNEKLAFAIMKRGLTAESLKSAKEPLELADLGLRFDLTVPLARFYATHRAALPGVFRAIQIAPVWRAERPQQGRYRQFVQCDIDIIGEAGPLAEVELITATASTLKALGLDGWSIRINDRRLLTGMLEVFGFPGETHDAALITMDKLDKIGPDGVVAELRERGMPDPAVAALQAFLLRPQTLEALPFGEAAIRKALPEGLDDTVIAQLAAIGQAAEAVHGAELVQFDPWLVRGMGYYTGPIFEVAHASLGYSLGGGGRYDGMIGRFLGTEVPATGFSLGFERLVDLVHLDDDGPAGSAVLLHDPDAVAADLVAVQSRLIASGLRVRLERRPKKVAAALERLAEAGFDHFAMLSAADAAQHAASGTAPELRHIAATAH